MNRSCENDRCLCRHERRQHFTPGMSENLIVGSGCMLCFCREFEEEPLIDAVRELQREPVR